MEGEAGQLTSSSEGPLPEHCVPPVVQLELATPTCTIHCTSTLYIVYKYNIHLRVSVLLSIRIHVYSASGLKLVRSNLFYLIV